MKRQTPNKQHHHPPARPQPAAAQDVPDEQLQQVVGGHGVSPMPNGEPWSVTPKPNGPPWSVTPLPSSVPWDVLKAE